MHTHIRAICVLNILAILLLTWYKITHLHGFWFNLDKSLFFIANNFIGNHPNFAHFIAIINNRMFDIATFGLLGLIYLLYYRKQDKRIRRKMIALGIIMLCVIFIMKQSTSRLIPIDHVSPTLYFTNVFHAGHISGIPTKDISSDSFPSDHGIALMIFASFMWRYFSCKTLRITAPLIVILSLPRITIGAHWFSDVYVGSLASCCIVLSWLLLTPACDFMIKHIVRLFPDKK